VGDLAGHGGALVEEPLLPGVVGLDDGEDDDAGGDDGQGEDGTGPGGIVVL
jgi:hypothetical protein